MSKAKRRVSKTIKRLQKGPSITGAPQAQVKTRKKKVKERQLPQSKKRRMREVAIITRKEQPFPMTGKITRIESSTGKSLYARVATVPKLEIAAGVGGMISSSWISSLEWQGKWVLMTLLNGYSYNVYINKRLFEQWFYAHSKGTFFNYMIKGKFKVVRAA